MKAKKRFTNVLIRLDELRQGGMDVQKKELQYIFYIFMTFANKFFVRNRHCLNI